MSKGVHTGSEGHALLAPSSSKRWLACTPSALIAAKMPNNTNTAAEEGTLAHLLAERMLMQYEGRLSVKTYNELFEEIKQHELYSDEMLRYVRGYVAYCIRIVEDMKRIDPNTRFYIELKVKLDELFSDSGGTSDFIVLGARKLVVVDLKYGRYEFVGVKNNPQLRIYALGAYYTLRAEFLFIRDFEIHVYQPRCNNIAHETVKLGDLLYWGKKMKNAAIKAAKGQGDFKAGAHCLYCPFKSRCQKCAEYYLELFDYMTEEMLDGELTPETLVEVIEKAQGLTKWVESIKERVTSEILSGKRYHGLKLVEGVGRRQITDVKKLAQALKIDPSEVVEVKPLGITAIEEKVGKKALVGAERFINIVEGKPVLTTSDDQRREYRSAAAEFAKYDEENEDDDPLGLYDEDDDDLESKFSFL